ncbi:MAG: aldo/keto reductase [Firmicutes bacterium]|nr:aldo/keto reductase [Bacillota bacterium]
MLNTFSLSPNMSAYGLGTTSYWSGRNQGLDACIHEAVEKYGISVLDTAEMYGNGRSEEALGKTIRDMNRETLFLVDKILPDNADEARFRNSLVNSLKRLKTDYLDLYLLHWRENADLSFVVPAMEAAVKEGLIRRWGVSNFDTHDLRDLLAVPGGANCFCNQIFYNVYERGCEYALVPLMKEHNILPMSYSSLGSNYYPHPDIHRIPPVMDVCRLGSLKPEALMLKWNVRHGFCTLFTTTSIQHLRDNLQEIPEDIYQRFEQVIEQEFPAPDHEYPLVKI